MRDHGERGQATVALVGVVVIVAVLGVGVSILAEAIVHRARARTAADAVALAAVVDPAAGQELRTAYERQGIRFDRVGSETIARSGPSRAHAHAVLGPAANRSAPVLVAIIARAEQLTGAPFDPLRWQRTSVSLDPAGASRLHAVAAELGLCETTTDPPGGGSGPSTGTGWVTFERC